VYLIWRLRGRKLKDPNLPPRWGLLFLYACLAGLSHILLDFTNNYGVRPFWPFSEKWYSWDIVFIWEPVMFSVLLLGLIVPSVFSLIDSEIGVRSRGPRGRVAATIALICVVSLWGLRDFEHRRAVNALAARTYQGADALRVSAYPALTNPFQWFGVVETPAFFALAPVNSLGPEVDPEDKLDIRYKPEETPVTLAAKKSYLGRVYLSWARYPITETEALKPPEGGYIVSFQDLRFVQTPGPLTRLVNMLGRLFGRRPGRTSKILGAEVELDRNLRVVGDVYGSDNKRTVVPEPRQRGGSDQ
jgi:inner membrane protein